MQAMLCRITPPNQQSADHLGINWAEHETNIGHDERTNPILFAIFLMETDFIRS
jgi:hypothetical protein